MTTAPSERGTVSEGCAVMGMHGPPPGGTRAPAFFPSHHLSLDNYPLKEKRPDLPPPLFCLLLTLLSTHNRASTCSSHKARCKATRCYVLSCLSYHLPQEAMSGPQWDRRTSVPVLIRHRPFTALDPITHSRYYVQCTMHANICGKPVTQR